MRVTDKSPAERTAEAQRLRDQGDPRPVSQIEAEMLAQDQAGQLDDSRGKQDKTSHKSDTSKPGGP